MRRPILAVVTTTKSRLMQCKGASALIAALFWTALPAFGHDASESSDLSSDAGRSHVTIKTEGDKRVIESNGLPDHKTGQFPNRGNPNSISAQHYKFEMPLKPKAASEARQLRGYLFGIAINGVVFDPGTAEIWQPGDQIVSRPG